MSAFPTPPSAFRLGISLTEVLIAMGIMTVGLLGVASVFPVASFYVHKAAVNDNGSMIAQAAMNDLIAHGYMDPRGWFVMTPTPSSSAINNPNYTMPAVDGKYAPHTGLPPWTKPASFTRPLAEAMAESRKYNSQSSNESQILSAQFGNAYVIDPMGMGGIGKTPGANLNNRYAYAFPAAAAVIYPGNNAYYYGSPKWSPWRCASGPPNFAALQMWPIRRVTFRSLATGYNVDRTDAESMFRCADDLAYDLPQRDDRPATQNFDTIQVSNQTAPLARKWTGDYSWLATVLPTTTAARNGIASGGNSYEYDVSVVVFYKRVVLSGDPSVTDAMEAMQAERSVGAKIVSSGLNGGQLLLWDFGEATTSAFTNLKSGQWIMLCGPSPGSTTADPRFSLNWYQVLSIDTTVDGVLTDPTKQRMVSVRGPQWPWQPRNSYIASQQNSDVAKLSDDLCVGIFRGAVAVHTKTMRLEDSRQSGLVATGKGSTSNPTETTWDPR